MKKKRAPEHMYPSEAAMCSQFMSYAADHGYVCYPETAGWDILLVRKTDGVQVGVEAKLQASLEVLTQAIRGESFWDHRGPDYRAVLVPAYAGKIGELQQFCPFLGVTLISARGPGDVDRNGMIACPGGWGRTYCFEPGLPSENGWSEDGAGRVWFDQVPSKREILPPYVPDVQAGVAAPVQLTHWKIGAMKIAILLDVRGHVKRSDFKHLHIDHRRWIAAGDQSILVADPPHGFKRRAGATSEGWRKEHPRNFEEIRADFDQWAPPVEILK